MSRFFYHTSSLNNVINGDTEKTFRLLNENVAKVEKGENFFPMEFVLNLMDVKNKDSVGTLKVKKEITFTEYEVMSVYNFEEVQNNKYYKILFNELRDEYKSLEDKSFTEILEYFNKNLQLMALRAAQPEGKPN